MIWKTCSARDALSINPHAMQPKAISKSTVPRKSNASLCRIPHPFPSLADLSKLAHS